jgi:hypothetical protein
MLVPQLLLPLQSKTCSTSSSCKHRRQNQYLQLTQMWQQLSLVQTQVVLVLQCRRTRMLQPRTSTPPLLLRLLLVLLQRQRCLLLLL